MSLKTKKSLKIIIPLLFGGGLIWYLFTIIPPKTLLEYFKNANYWWISLGLFFGILSHLSRAYRWKFMLKPMGYTPRFINSALAVLIGYFVNLAIPRAGEVSRASVMANYENIPFEKGFGTIVAERIADLIMMFLIIGVTLLIQFDFILQLVKEKLDPVKIIIGLAVCLIGGFFFYKYVRKSTKGLGLKIKKFIKSLVEGVTSIFRMKNKWPFIFHTVFIWAMYVLMFWATIPAIDGLQVPFGGILVGFIAGGFSIAATNGGIGLYPLAVAGAFTLFGVPEEPSTAFGSVMWAAQTAMVILFGGLSFLLLPICNKAK
ncbi:flippase-like domain-containing protein [Flavobacteriaceae bacterium]|nr:flippase-like domain-containing protein [Flavobacteriaceae bacterium]MDB9780896.1 flippase-like domain-containing protein [Flavobacteriaceae bacterium]MDB9798793.1 flippase-like domain-containing protein [Flavobacteriaceae bacterium]